MVKKREKGIKLWCSREYANLKKAWKAGVRCPKPYSNLNNVLLMEFIGNNFQAAPKLSNLKLLDPKSIYSMLVEDLKKLLSANLVHADFSAYNVLMWQDQPRIIDFSHALLSTNPEAGRFFERDLRNLLQYFGKYGIDESVMQLKERIAPEAFKSIG